MKSSLLALASLVTVLAPSAAIAHPGHGTVRGSSNALHYLADHPLVALTLIASLAIVAWRRSSTN